MLFYAVIVGRKLGIYNNWITCAKQIINYPGAVLKNSEILMTQKITLSIIQILRMLPFSQKLFQISFWEKG